MAIAYKITKEDYEALPEALKTEYAFKGESYVLDLTGVDLKAHEKYEGERMKRRDAEKTARDAQTALQEFQDGDDRPALIEKHTKDLQKLTKVKEQAELKLTDYIRRNTLEADAKNLADGLSKTNSRVLLPHITSRLDVDLTDPDNPKTIVLDSDGKPSTKTLDELRAEFVANKDFAGIITGSQATGGAASRPGSTGRSGLPSGTGAQNSERPNLSNMSPRELAAHITSQRQSAGLETPVVKS